MNLGAPRRSRAATMGPERRIQTAVFAWARMSVNVHSQLELLYAVPNGGGLRHSVKRAASGKNIRYSPEGKRLKQEGLTEGMPDVNLDVAAGIWHGLRIEHKAPGAYPTPMQRYRMALLTVAGFLCLVSRDVEDSIAAIKEWIALSSDGAHPNIQTLDRLRFSPKPADFTKPAPKPRRK